MEINFGPSALWSGLTIHQRANRPSSPSHFFRRCSCLLALRGYVSTNKRRVSMGKSKMDRIVHVLPTTTNPLEESVDGRRFPRRSNRQAIAQAIGITRSKRKDGECRLVHSSTNPMTCRVERLTIRRPAPTSLHFVFSPSIIFSSTITLKKKEEATKNN